MKQRANIPTLEWIEKTCGKIRNSRKYRALSLPESTICALLRQEWEATRSDKIAEERTREKLHQIIAPYLGEIDYPATSASLADCRNDQQSLNTFARTMLESHSSTKERIPHLSYFYETLFAHIGKPNIILDLACAMNPFALPWMNLSNSVAYYAYDLHTPRVSLLNQFFSAWGIKPLAETRDILLDTPSFSADIAFFFKEAHRFESRQKGCCSSFFEKISTPYIAVTLPAENLTGTHQMRNRQRDLIEKAIAGQSWTLTEWEIGTEMVFLIKK